MTRKRIIELEIPGEGGEDRADNENGETPDVYFFPADGIAEFAPDRHENGVCENVRGGYPCRIGGEDIEVQHDLRYGKAHDGLVHGTEEGADHDREKNQPPVPVIFGHKKGLSGDPHLRGHAVLQLRIGGHVIGDPDFEFLLLPLVRDGKDDVPRPGRRCNRLDRALVLG